MTLLMDTCATSTSRREELRRAAGSEPPAPGKSDSCKPPQPTSWAKHTHAHARCGVRWFEERRETRDEFSRWKEEEGRDGDWCKHELDESDRVVKNSECKTCFTRGKRHIQEVRDRHGETEGECLSKALHRYTGVARGLTNKRASKGVNFRSASARVVVMRTCS